MSELITEELREVSLRVSQAILNDGSMSVSGEWSTLFDGAVDCIEKLEAQLDAVRIFSTSHVHLENGEVFIKVRRDVYLKALGENDG